MSDISFDVLTGYAVRGADGKIDFDATINKFGVRLVEFEAACEKEEAAIADAVTHAFDAFASDSKTKGAPQNMDTVVFMSIQELNPNPNNFKILSNRIKDWLRINADQSEVLAEDEKTVLREAEAPRTRMFSIKKGKGGGVRRWSDVPEETSVSKPAD